MSLRGTSQSSKKLLAVYCMLALLFAGCGRRLKVHSFQQSVKKRTASKFSQHIRAVFEASRGNQALSSSATETTAAEDEIALLLNQVHRHPEDVKARHDLAQALIREGQFELALYQLQKLRELVPPAAGLELTLARVWQNLGGFSNAALYAQTAVQLGDEVNGLATLAVLSEQLGDTQQARAHFEQVVQLAPHRADLWTAYGHLQMRAARLEEAQILFTKALAIEPNRKGALKALAEVLIRLNRADRGTELLLQLYEPVKAFRLAGLLLKETENWSEAHRTLSRVAQLAPEDRLVMDHLAELESYLPLPQEVVLPSFSSAPDASIQLGAGRPLRATLPKDLVEAPASADLAIPGLIDLKNPGNLSIDLDHERIATLDLDAKSENIALLSLSWSRQPGSAETARSLNPLTTPLATERSAGAAHRVGTAHPGVEIARLPMAHQQASKDLLIFLPPADLTVVASAEGRGFSGSDDWITWDQGLNVMPKGSARLTVRTFEIPLKRVGLALFSFGGEVTLPVPVSRTQPKTGSRGGTSGDEAKPSTVTEGGVLTPVPSVMSETVSINLESDASELTLSPTEEQLVIPQAPPSLQAPRVPAAGAEFGSEKAAWAPSPSMVIGVGLAGGAGFGLLLGGPIGALVGAVLGGVAAAFATLF